MNTVNAKCTQCGRQVDAKICNHKRSEPIEWIEENYLVHSRASTLYLHRRHDELQFLDEQ